MITTAYSLIQLSSLLLQSEGNSRMAIGIIDGPVDTSHADLPTSAFRSVDDATPATCKTTSSFACKHGTFVAGILAANRNAEVPGISPACSFLARPIFCEAADFNQCPVVTTEHLVKAIQDVMQKGAKVINLSLGLAPGGIRKGQSELLHNVFDEAFQRGVIIVGASGNHGRIGHNPLFDHPWVIPVVACDQQARPVAASNIGMSIGQRGLLAPGWNMKHIKAGGGFMNFSGTSVAAPFVTGSISLLWSMYPNAKAGEVHAAFTKTGPAKRGIIPPLLNVAQSKTNLERSINAR